MLAVVADVLSSCHVEWDEACCDTCNTFWFKRLLNDRVSLPENGRKYIFGLPTVSLYIIKIKIHSSCEIEDFVETHLCKLCVILGSRALRVVCPH